ncbi:MAG: hypothetical protein JJU34_04220 [Lunatimonas sp.]|uniref:hypothetical protein n=1 Tax=Lunatimonas sp. TaxID=2060141 RepID=UPI00263B1AF9|nr:hypothetical protein [Lunatimonas sp.]MCC5936463.1 hypothetical protein [Lunatimonas sp.]
MKKYGDHNVSLNIKNTSKNKYASILWRHTREIDEERFNISGGLISNLTDPSLFEEINEPIELTVNNDNEDHRITYEIIPNWDNSIISVRIKDYPKTGHSLITDKEENGFDVGI